MFTDIPKEDLDLDKMFYDDFFFLDADHKVEYMNSRLKPLGLEKEFHFSLDYGVAGTEVLLDGSDMVTAEDGLDVSELDDYAQGFSENYDDGLFFNKQEEYALRDYGLEDQVRAKYKDIVEPFRAKYAPQEKKSFLSKIVAKFR